MPDQHEILDRSPLLDANGRLVQKGYARRPLLDYNPEYVRRHAAPWLNRLRLKEWDYYGVFIGRRFFSATVSDIGYMGLVFVYWIDLDKKTFIERSVVTPFGRGCRLPRSSESGDVLFEKGRLRIAFERSPGLRRIKVNWPGFDGGRTLSADLTLHQPDDHEGIVMATPIGDKGFYYNHKLSALPCEGSAVLGGDVCAAGSDAFGALDWGRGVWDYDTFWNWACGFGRLPDGRYLGINLGLGFGDLSAATENSFFLDGRLQKLGRVGFQYSKANFLAPWRFADDAGRLDLTLTPLLDRAAKTNLILLKSEAHQIFGTYSGRLVSDAGEIIRIDAVPGWAEEHHARW
ncbi:MAG: DUF2804 domain-containing protein [Dehalococcoidia bacterium]|nr:MAG: DUF2804 domain-containing protein [Dehalococcoidia bacterium]